MWWHVLNCSSTNSITYNNNCRTWERELSMDFKVNTKYHNIFLDNIFIYQTGVLSVSGWSEDWRLVVPVVLRVDGNVIDSNEFYRKYRPDVATSLKSENFFLGFVVEFILPQNLDKSLIEILVNKQAIWEKHVTFHFVKPHYPELLNESSVKFRSDIYSSGPPNLTVSQEIARLEFFIYGQVLDFGCGSGSFVKFLRDKNIEAFGIELNKPEIKNVIANRDISKYVTLYDGKLPLPFDDCSFDCITSIEVIEHVDEINEVLFEIQRIVRKRFIMTVPDISAIPRCYPENAVPWHLLEATHLNFFTIKSLEKFLSRFFTNIIFFKVGTVHLNESQFETSIVAICEKTD